MASTRVRDDLLITNIEPLSEFLTNRITHLMQHGHYVRTTLEIDDEVLLAVKQIAERKTTAGKVVSNLLRESLEAKSFEHRVPRRRSGAPAQSQGSRGHE